MSHKKEIRKSIFVIALPIIVQNLVQYFQIMVDTAMLGRYRAIYLSALGNILFPYFTMLSFLMAASAGITILISHSCGAKKEALARRYTEASFFYNSCITMVFCVFWLLFSTQTLTLMGASGEVLFAGRDYVRILALSLPFMGIELTAVAALQGYGVTRPIMYTGIVRNVMNAALDYLLIFGHFGFPELGIEGAAIASTAANISASIILLLYLLKSRKLPSHIRLGGVLRPSWRVYRKVIKIGFPAGLELMLFNLGQLVIVRMLNVMDDMAVGIYSLMHRVKIFGLFVYLGFARAGLTLIGKRLGAKDALGALKVGLTVTRYSLLVTASCALLFFALPREILHLFIDTSAGIAVPGYIPEWMMGFFSQEYLSVERTVPILYIVALLIFPQTINVVIGDAIRGSKDTRWMLSTQVFGTVFMIAGAAVLILGVQAGLLAVFVLGLIDEMLRGAVNFWRFVSKHKDATVETDSVVKNVLYRAVGIKSILKT